MVELTDVYRHMLIREYLVSYGHRMLSGDKLQYHKLNVCVDTRNHIGKKCCVLRL